MLNLMACFQCDSCEGAWVPVLCYLIFNCAFNIFIILVVKVISSPALMAICASWIIPKFHFVHLPESCLIVDARLFVMNISFPVVQHGSAALLYIIMTLRLPIVNLAFSWKAIENPPEPVTVYTFVGLGIIISGLISYRMGSMPPAEASVQNENENETMMSSTTSSSSE
jgi:hypothetical protein